MKKEKEITEYNLSNLNEIKNIRIKHDTSAEKKFKNLNIDISNKNKLITIDIFEEDIIMMLYDNNVVIQNKIG